MRDAHRNQFHLVIFDGKQPQHHQSLVIADLIRIVVEVQPPPGTCFLFYGTYHPSLSQAYCFMPVHEDPALLVQLFNWETSPPIPTGTITGPELSRQSGTAGSGPTSPETNEVAPNPEPPEIEDETPTGPEGPDMDLPPPTDSTCGGPVTGVRGES